MAVPDVELADWPADKPQKKVKKASGVKTQSVGLGYGAKEHKRTMGHLKKGA